jgi:hypothetical protein
LSCDGYLLEGVDANYYINAVAGKSYGFTFRNHSTRNYFFPYIHTSSSCLLNDIQKDCNSGGASGLASGFVETGIEKTFVYTAKKSGPVYFVVDDTFVTGAAPYTLTVSEVVLPSNQTCATAALIPTTGGSGVGGGNLGGVSNEFTGLQCAESSSTKLDGEQLYWRFVGVAGLWYRIEVQNSAITTVYPFVFTNRACTAAALQTGLRQRYDR